MENIKTFEDFTLIEEGEVSSMPSGGIAGSSIGPNWASNGGSVGPGAVNVPYNPGGGNRMFQKVPMGKNHGARTGKKSREKKVDLKALRDEMRKKKEEGPRPKGKRAVLDFDDFLKKDITTIKK